MITALNIEEYPRKGIAGALNLIRHNRIRVEHLYCDRAALKSVTYEHYRGKIGWGSIDRFVKAQRNRVLCPEELRLPSGLGYKRYESRELNRRMCENAALYLLRSCSGRSVKAVLLDSSGDSVGICEYMAEYVNPVCVVTEAVELYIAEAERLLNEKGAALRVSKSRGCLSGADLIISAERIETHLDCPDGAVILSPYKPSAESGVSAIYDYCFELPQKYRDIKPSYLGDMYFASALYSLAGARELGAELFSRCGDGTVLHTRMSLPELLNRRLYERSHS